MPTVQVGRRQVRDEELRTVGVRSGVRHGHGSPAVGRLVALLERERFDPSPFRAQKFRLFLDRDMNYSCAYFEHDGQSLENSFLIFLSL